MTLPSPPFQLSTPWRWHNPVSIQFGRGVRQQIPQRLPGAACLVVSSARGRQQLSTDPLLAAWVRRAPLIWVDNIRANPDLRDLQRCIDSLERQHFDAVIAYGGGSVIDAAKVLTIALAEPCRGLSLHGLLTNPERYDAAQPKPLFAVPTTSGTGSEVTPFATVWDHQQQRKYSLTGPAVFPHTAWIDPELTDTVPLDVTLATGLDAINQAAESIWNRHASAMTLNLATRALQLGFAALPPLIQQHAPALRYRECMAEASLLAGLAISQTRTALCHSISYPLTAHFGVPHGLACAFTMPAVLRHNLPAEDGRFAHLACAVLGPTARPDDLLPVFDQLHHNLEVRERVRRYIPSWSALLDLAPEMITPGRADNVLAGLEADSVEKILRGAWQSI